jgi:hypothetical protein
MPVWVWGLLIDSLWHEGDWGNTPLPGQNLPEWLSFVGRDYDAVDKIYTDHEVLGGE